MALENKAVLNEMQLTHNLVYEIKTAVEQFGWIWINFEAA